MRWKAITPNGVVFDAMATKLGGLDPEPWSRDKVARKRRMNRSYLFCKRPAASFGASYILEMSISTHPEY
jgi:hypothetical protein